MIRFRELSLSQKKSYSEVVRDALLFYMDHYDQAKRNELEGVYAQQLKASTNRICGLMAKTGIEVHAIIEFLRRMDGGPELVQDCLALASKRLDKGLEMQAEKIKDKMAKVVSAEGAV
jgi:isochorismate hydrolase